MNLIVRLVLNFVVILVCVSQAMASPQLSTNGTCSSIAASGGVNNTNCYFGKFAGRGKLVIKNAWLVPAPGFMSKSPDGSANEQAVFVAVVKNLSPDSIVINAAKLEISGKTVLSLNGFSDGVGIIGPHVGNGSSISIGPGQTAKISFSQTVALGGIIEEIENSIKTDEVMIIEQADPPRSNGFEYVTGIARIMSKLYGSNTYLRATFYTEDYFPLAKFRIPINTGADLFYNGEVMESRTKKPVFRPKLAYDAFLGGYLKQKELWVPGFKIRETPKRCIDAIPDMNVPGGFRYSDVKCN